MQSNSCFYLLFRCWVWDFRDRVCHSNEGISLKTRTVGWESLRVSASSAIDNIGDILVRVFFIPNIFYHLYCNRVGNDLTFALRLQRATRPDRKNTICRPMRNFEFPRFCYCLALQKIVALIESNPIPPSNKRNAPYKLVASSEKRRLIAYDCYLDWNLHKGLQIVILPSGLWDELRKLYQCYTLCYL